MIKTHHFQVDDAVLYGVDKAVLLNNLKYWLDHAKANGKKDFDGYFWTFNSSTAFSQLIPYMSAKKISRLLKELEDDSVIIVGNYNRANYDRTKWYTMPEYASQAISQNREMDCSELGNALSIIEQPIPDINTDNKHTNKQVNKQTSKPIINNAKKKSHSIPQEWLPNEKHAESCLEKGLLINDLVEHFRDHHISKGSKMADWDAAFRNWIRNAVKFNKPATRNTGQQVALLGQPLVSSQGKSFDQLMGEVIK